MTPDELGRSDAANGEKGALLGRLLLEARQSRQLSQGQLAKLLNLKSLTAPAISNFEKSQRLPSWEQLLHLAKELNLDLESLALARAHDELLQEFQQDGTQEWPAETLGHQTQLLSAMRVHFEQASRVASLRRQRKGRTFLDFPEAFPNITVVTGDKREYPPKNAGDIGAYSASTIDDRWIHRLGLPRETEKVSDKEFVLSNRDRLCKVYGQRTLLVIGSPASNHLARVINENAVFRFNLHPNFTNKINELLQELRAEKDREVLERKNRENQGLLKPMMRAFCAYGIIDPILGDVRGFALPPDKDYATITFAKNPYYEGDDFQYVAIMVAGFHHPGTCWALRCLSKPYHERLSLDRHPYGGVLEVTINEANPWEERMRFATPAWDTEPYDKKALMEGLAKMPSRSSALLQIPSGMDVCQRLIESL